ncbi:nucleoside permease [Tamlana sp. 2201CG12-4]|uniref:nucleoside permease n=1 Tax=Tamlana sp. 2201CG12-4 TaxID=3112582 RepID=UPI002DBA2B4E|nr:nucleoside permease [Tamlana sp. 2201CG12-4]MEC3906740.1 nucleoside permease [Tamlana sp. 2201CG12-4]
MGIKQRLIIFNFLEFFVWGTWLISAGAYMSVTLKFTGIQIGSVYATLGLASLFMPAIMGAIADKWLSAEKLFGMSHLILVVFFIGVTQVASFSLFYVLMLFVSMFYMPTIGLNNAISYHILEDYKYDIIKAFPPIRVWGTIGFIIAAWCIDLLQWQVGKEQFYLAAIASGVLGIYSFTLPKIPTSNTSNQTLIQRLGLDAFVLFKKKNIAVFLIFSVLLGAALQITNIWGVPFLTDFEVDYKDSFAVKHSVFLMSLSQISEVIFILFIPFCLKKFGIKKVMLMSLFAWIFRFGFFGIGSPSGLGVMFLILSMIIYGLAFDFFNISGSLFIDKEVSPKIRSSAQGLFMMMVNGVGAFLGGYASGLVVDCFTEKNIKDWSSIWFVFAGYALVIGIAFALLFKYKHNSEENFNQIKH